MKDTIVRIIIGTLVAATFIPLAVVAAGLWGKFILVPAVEWVETL